ncbi:hypothetical protein QAD02_001188 [Eretmocerus hayati]|uniref:Uncharacterized protein n=1 Tax=Eretmocerus hayati TaxID=131215 RepID=A0ACC2NFR7_9HYME|nr:hypothetical protein QAD02_001188 [Eretmocerus hayati]
MELTTIDNDIGSRSSAMHSESNTIEESDDYERLSHEAGSSRGQSSSSQAENLEPCAAMRRRLEQQHNILTEEFSDLDHSRQFLSRNQDFLSAYLINYMQDNPNLADHQRRFLSQLREIQRIQMAEYENACNRVIDSSRELGATVAEINRLSGGFQESDCRVSQNFLLDDQSGESE